MLPFYPHGTKHVLQLDMKQDDGDGVCVWPQSWLLSSSQVEGKTSAPGSKCYFESLCRLTKYEHKFHLKESFICSSE